MFVDSHCHLNREVLAVDQIGELGRALSPDALKMINIFNSGFPRAPPI